MFAGAICYSICLSLIKISVLLLYRSIFPIRGFNMATNVIETFVLA